MKYLLWYLLLLSIIYYMVFWLFTKSQKRLQPTKPFIASVVFVGIETIPLGMGMLYKCKTVLFPLKFWSLESIPLK